MNIPERIKSRKFWVAIISFVYFILNGQSDQAFGIIIAYLGIQGLQDTYGSNNTMTQIIKGESHNEDEEVDTSIVETGKAGIPLFNEEVKDEE